MKRSYIILFAMSFLILSTEQCFALDNIPSSQQEVVASQLFLQNLEYPQRSTDQYVYDVVVTEKSAEQGDVVVEPAIISDKVVNNYFNNGKTRTLITQETKDGKTITKTETWKTKNPSYLTFSNGALVVSVVGIVALQYFTMKAIDRVQGLKEQALEEQMYIKHLGEHYFESYKKWLLKTDQSEVSVESFVKYCKLMAAVHESGHALEGFLVDPASWMIKASITEFEDSDGSVLILKHGIHNNLFPASLKNNTKIGLAGGVAMSIFQGKKLSFEDFLSTKLYGMGDRDNSGSDIHRVYKNSEKYFGRMNSIIGSWIPKDYSEQEREQATQDFLKECYEETYQDLSLNKDKLVAMTNALHEKKELYSNEIYTIASGKTQKFFGLMSSNEQWKKYFTDILRHESKTMLNLYEKSPYEMYNLGN